MRKELRSYQILAILGKVILINFKEKMLNIRIDKTQLICNQIFYFKKRKYDWCKSIYFILL
jgi:hypothetical protein